MVSTLAGIGELDPLGEVISPGYSGDGGLAANAALAYPLGVAVDARGNLYIADAGNNRIRKINATTGIITTLAGDGFWGYTGDGGPAVNAEIEAGRIAVDPAGNVYIADYSHHVIRKISVANGLISTIAGRGVPGYNGEGVDAINAYLNYPSGITIDASGNIYISDGGNPGFVYGNKNARIRKISATDGKIRTVAGSGASWINNLNGYSGDGPHATAYLLNFPSGIYVDANNVLYIADTDNHSQNGASSINPS